MLPLVVNVLTIGNRYGAKNRTSTVLEPFLLIADAVHHWDENGLFPNQTTATLPPPPIKQVQSQEVQFVEKWMQEWHFEHHAKPGWPPLQQPSSWPSTWPPTTWRA